MIFLVDFTEWRELKTDLAQELNQGVTRWYLALLHHLGSGDLDPHFVTPASFKNDVLSNSKVH